jgi:hypothetical protein
MLFFLGGTEKAPISRVYPTTSVFALQSRHKNSRNGGAARPGKKSHELLIGIPDVVIEGSNHGDFDYH